MKITLDTTKIKDTAVVEAEALESRKSNAVNTENVRVGETRKDIITAIPGQEMIYLRKEQEALDWVADIKTKDATNFPFIFNEVGITADTADQVAQVFLNKSHMWIQIALQMEKDRLLKVESIKSATTDEELRLAR